MSEIKFLTALGARIREVRKEKGITQTKLAETCEIEKANMSRIESGQTNVTVLTLWKISKALDTPVAELLVNSEVHASSAVA
jgi:transcriptional regulator with XRE-family HTH domain